MCAESRINYIDLSGLFIKKRKTQPYFDLCYDSPRWRKFFPRWLLHAFHFNQDDIPQVPFTRPCKTFTTMTRISFYLGKKSYPSWRAFLFLNGQASDVSWQSCEGTALTETVMVARQVSLSSDWQTQECIGQATSFFFSFSFLFCFYNEAPAML